MAKYRLGILGGGQLARMSVMAAQRMGVSVVSLDEDPESPAAQVGPSIVGSIHEPESIAEVMKDSDFVTFENEFIQAETLRQACRLANFPKDKVIPGIDTLETIQDKLLQRQAYMSAGCPSPKAVPAENACEIGFPCVLKARYGGYDGKGTRYTRTEAEYEELRPVWESGGWLAEELVDFTQEIAVMVVARKDGQHHAFPSMVTEQKKYVCDLVYPCFDAKVASCAQQVAIDAVKSIKGVGLFGVELFLDANGRVSINEIAPRPHNTGHYTLDWGGTSQFEAHVQIVLGCFDRITEGISTCMANVLGVENARDLHRAYDRLTAVHPQARFHWYGKKDSKPGRKMGHINVVDTSLSYRSEKGRENEIIGDAQACRETFLEAWSEA